MTSRTDDTPREAGCTCHNRFFCAVHSPAISTARAADQVAVYEEACRRFRELGPRVREWHGTITGRINAEPRFSNPQGPRFIGFDPAAPGSEYTAVAVAERTAGLGYTIEETVVERAGQHVERLSMSFDAAELERQITERIAQLLLDQPAEPLAPSGITARQIADSYEMLAQAVAAGPIMAEEIKAACITVENDPADEPPRPRRGRPRAFK